MIVYIERSILPYITKKREELKLQFDYPALVIFEKFTGQGTKKALKLLKNNNIHVVLVPATAPTGCNHWTSVSTSQHIGELPLRCHLSPVRGRTASSMHTAIVSQCDDWHYEKLFLLVHAKGGAWFINPLFAAFGISLLFSSHAYILSFYYATLTMDTQLLRAKQEMSGRSPSKRDLSLERVILRLQWINWRDCVRCQKVQHSGWGNGDPLQIYISRKKRAI